VVLAIGSREHIDENCHGGASVEEDTTDRAGVLCAVRPDRPDALSTGLVTRLTGSRDRSAAADGGDYIDA
jgi:hypothetical protein